MSHAMPITRDLIKRLKNVREEQQLSLDDIARRIEENGDFVSKTTLSRVFADGSEEKGFRYEFTIRPIAKALLDIENIEEDDSMDVQAMKSLLKYKIQRIEDLEKEIQRLETELDKEKIKALQKIEEETTRFQKANAFLNDQIALKDKRIDHLLDTNAQLMTKLLDCPCRIGDDKAKEKK